MERTKSLKHQVDAYLGKLVKGLYETFYLQFVPSFVTSHKFCASWFWSKTLQFVEEFAYLYRGILLSL